MDTTSVGMADSVERSGATPIFDELVGRYGLKPQAEATVTTAATGEPAAEEDVLDELRADEAVAAAS
jgi:hypothetical protein